MNIYMIGFIILLVGVPACSGAYIVARNFGSEKTSGGFYLLVFAVLACVTLYLFPQSRLDPADYSVALIAIFVIAFASGAGLGILFKRAATKQS